MPDVALQTADTATTTTSRSTSSGSSRRSRRDHLSDSLVDPLASEGTPAAKKAKKEEVVVYLTQNDTTHHTDEIPEALASLEQAEKEGKGSKKLIPISDPYRDGTRIDAGAFGEEAAKKMIWWHDDPTLAPGQVKVGEKVLTLGAREGVESDLPQIQEDWKELLVSAGLSKSRAAEVVAALMTDASGKAKLTASGAGASNELAQLIAVLDRAERGEFDITTLVLSGHHYQGTDYLFGENSDHTYDSDTTLGDTFNMQDVEALKGVFPKAFKQVKAVMFNACNTHDLGMRDAEGNERSTNEWIQETFPSVESTSYWEGIAPGPDMGAFFAGEFLLDTSRKGGGDAGAFKDARYQATASGKNKRSDRKKDGKLGEVETKRNQGSYVYNDYKGYRGTAGVSFSKLKRLGKYLKK